MNPDWWLVAIIAFGVFFFTSIFWISYGSHKADQLRSDHADHIAQVHEGYAIQRTVYGSVPITKLVGREDST